MSGWFLRSTGFLSQSGHFSRNDDLAGCTGCNWRSGLHGQFLKLSQRGRLTMSLQGSHLGAVVPGWKMRALGSFSGPLLGRVAAGF